VVAVSTEIEFGTGHKDVADSIRDDHADHLCSDDDRRSLTVTYSSDTPEEVIEEARRAAEDTRGTSDSAAGQAPLTDRERQELDFNETTVPEARAAKAVFLDEGVNDWLSYWSEDLTTTSEAREAAQRAKRDQRGSKRIDDEEDVDEKAADAARTAQSEECDHAAGFCRHGDPEACEFIERRCGMDADEVLRERAPEPRPNPEQPDPAGEEITGKAAGALQRSWSGYQAALAQLADALETLRDTWDDAQKAAKAINGIRQSHGQERLHFERLEAAQADHMDILRHMAADCTECHADHSEHDHDVTVSPIEDIRVTVTEGPSETPVGISEHTQEAVESLLEADDPAPTPNSEQFADEMQGTLSTGVDAEEVAEEKQVTLTGGDAGDPQASALPREWRTAATTAGIQGPTKWDGGPYTVAVEQSDGGQSWDVEMWGPDNQIAIATGLRSEDAQAVAEAFVARIKPPDVSFHSSDAEVQTAIAEAKREAIDASGGLSNFTQANS